jgi:hypothetical protein
LQQPILLLLIKNFRLDLVSSYFSLLYSKDYHYVYNLSLYVNVFLLNLSLHCCDVKIETHDVFVYNTIHLVMISMGFFFHASLIYTLILLFTSLPFFTSTL